MMFVTQTSPEGIQSNLAAWAKFFGIDDPPEWLQSQLADEWTFWIGAALVGAVALSLAWGAISAVPWVRRRRGQQRLSARRKLIGIRAKQLSDRMLEFFALHVTAEVPRFIPRNLPDDEQLRIWEDQMARHRNEGKRVIGEFKRQFAAEYVSLLNEMEEVGAINGLNKRGFIWELSTSDFFAEHAARQIGGIGVRLANGDAPPDDGWQRD